MKLNITELDRPLIGSEKFNVLDILNDVCRQFDERLIICFFLIASFWVILKIVLPIAYATFSDYLDSRVTKDPRVVMVRPIFDKVVKFYHNITENIAMISCVYGIFVLWQIGLDTKFKVWGYILLGIVVVSGVTNIIGWFRNNRGKPILKDWKTKVKELREAIDDE